MDRTLLTEHALRVRDFMSLARQELPEQPVSPSLEVRVLRARLLMEEVLETIEALGIEVYLGEEPVWFVNLEFVQVRSFADVTEVADGCADISVVATGTLLACGLPDKPFLEAVDQNNLEKFGPGHKLHKNGKLIKPPNHKPPDLESIISKL